MVLYPHKKIEKKKKKEEEEEAPHHILQQLMIGGIGPEGVRCNSSLVTHPHATMPGLLPCPRKSNNLRTHTFKCKKRKRSWNLAFATDKAGKLMWTVHPPLSLFSPLLLHLLCFASIISIFHILPFQPSCCSNFNRL